jgi:hypothetical protein
MMVARATAHGQRLSVGMTTQEQGRSAIEGKRAKA